MRGKVVFRRNISFEKRITPAYAGKSIRNNYIYPILKDHPRLCGEKQILCCLLTFFRGSPPPMRGKASGAFSSGSDVGITPAYAGKSIWSAKIFERILGSPPPMRGKVNLSEHLRSCFGITPAYAGKSFPATLLSLTLMDHPRLCGEKQFSTANVISE